MIKYENLIKLGVIKKMGLFFPFITSIIKFSQDSFAKIMPKLLILILQIIAKYP